MDRDDRLNDNQPAAGPAGPGSFDDSVGAYLLGALDKAELAAFETQLRTDPELRADVAGLRPVVALLPLALDADDLPQPTAGLRSRILQAARDDAVPESSGDAGGRPPAVVAPPQTSRPITAPVDQGTSSARGTVLPFVRRIGLERMVAGLLALIAAGALIWGITLQSRLNDTEDDLDAARDELASVQDGEDGVVRTVAYLLSPTAEGPETANAIVELQAEDSTEASLNALGMPATEEGRVYQLWFLNLTDAGEIEGAPRPSITFQVGADGAARVDEVPVDAPFEAVAITNEPAGGSPSPTTAVIMLGTRGVAAG